MTILFILLKSVAIAIPVFLIIAATICTFILSSGHKEKEDEEQMKWLREYQERKLATCTIRRKKDE